MKILRRSLCIISIILFSFALSILIPSVQASKIVLDDLIIFLYLIGVIILGILLLSNRFDYLSFSLSIILLLTTSIAWIRFPMISIIYTFLLLSICFQSAQHSSSVLLNQMISQVLSF